MIPKHNIKRILLAGGTGYLGNYIAGEMKERGLTGLLIARSPEKLQHLESSRLQIVKAEVTSANTLTGIANNVDTVISTVGITRQKDGLTYMDVENRANLNLLNEAKKAGVRKFIYVSAINGNKHRNLKILEAKEAFVDELKKSGLEYTIVRPNGFFSDMKDFLDMAKKGKVYLFGNGEQLLNPIHGEDLAKLCLDLVDDDVKEISVGGPDILTHNEIAELAFSAQGKVPSILHLPDWIRRLTLWAVRKFTSISTYGPLEFFLTLMADDNVAMRYGKNKLQDFYLIEARNSQ